MRPDPSHIWRPAAPPGSDAALPGSEPVPEPAPGAEPPSSAAPRYAGLTSAADIAARQRAADRRRDVEARRASLEGLTPRVALQEVHEVLVGLAGDLLDRRVPLARALARRNRLRGLGILLLLACAAWIAVAY